jgi:peptidoglycan hydrolase-like protein with peptidoglycan-binding domain
MTRVHRMDMDDEDDFVDERPARRRRGNRGIVARSIDAALRNPVMAAGTVISGLAIVIIVTNALSNQPLHHPSPLFNTRQGALTPPASALPPVPVANQTTMPPVGTAVTQVPPAPVAAVATVNTVSPTSNQPPTLQPLQAVAPAQPAPLNPVSVTQTTASTTPAPLSPPQPSPQTIERIQRELHDRGFYTGAIDGIAGPATSEAVRAFEQRLGVAAHGEATDRVLTLLHSARGRTIREHPVAPVAAVKPQSSPVASAQPLVQRATMQQMPAPIPPEPLTASTEGKTQRVQRALNIAGYGMIRTDGRVDEATVGAIKRFEIEHGMPVTGHVSDRLVSALGMRSASAQE